MGIDVLLGLQWGDEGKGKIVDVLSKNYDVVARFQGGPNAGHSLKFDDKKFVLHLIPSGIFQKHTINLIGNGVVIDPIALVKELDELKNEGIQPKKNLYISHKAHLIMPTHRCLDAASEKSKGTEKIGSTLKGIGPTYMDKIGRNNLRIGNIFEPDFKEKYQKLKAKHINLLKQYQTDCPFLSDEQQWFEAINYIKKLNVINGEYFINQLLKERKKILAEGAQGSLLDVDFGTYPYVTSSNTITAGACTGLGVSPDKIKNVIGIFKAYITRVGSGPFPTELFDDTGKKLQDIGNEFGATTGRPRRCGWLDIVALKYAIMIDGVTELVITKSDVLDSFDTIHVATHYQLNDGSTTDKLPFTLEHNIKPIFKSIPGWKNSITHCKSRNDLPENFLNFLKFIEEETGIPIKIISVGSDRTETILC